MQPAQDRTAKNVSSPLTARGTGATFSRDKGMRTSLWSKSASETPLASLPPESSCPFSKSYTRAAMTQALQNERIRFRREPVVDIP